MNITSYPTMRSTPSTNSALDALGHPPTITNTADASYGTNSGQRYHENLIETVLGPGKQQGLFDLLTSAAIKVKETNDAMFVVYVTAAWGCSFGREAASEFFADAKTDCFFVDADVLYRLDHVILDKTVCQFLHLQAAVFIGSDIYFKKCPVIVNTRATKALIALGDTLEHAREFGASIQYAGEKIVVTPIAPM